MLRRLCAIGLLLLAVAGCGSGGVPKPDEVQRGCTTDVADASGIRLTYQARTEDSSAPAPADLAATAEQLCRRMGGTRLRRPAVAVQGDRIVAVLPEGTSKVVVDYLASPGRLVFYDWEPVLLDEDCRTDPGRNANERTPVVGRKRADSLARKCGGDAIVVRQERVDPRSPKPDAWWVIRDRPVLGGEDIVDPVAETDPQTDEPVVAMRFTEAGNRDFTELTRRIAERGADNALPGRDPLSSSHHFGIVLDDELISTPFIDYAESPDGFSGDNGAQIAGGYTEESARLLAQILALGPLPLRLELVERRDQG